MNSDFGADPGLPDAGAGGLLTDCLVLTSPYVLHPPGFVY